MHRIRRSSLKQRAQPNDTVFVFGSEPQIPFYAGLKHASRYIFVYPLTTAFPTTRDRQAYVLRELTEAPPQFIVVLHDEGSYLSDQASPTLLREGLQKMLDADYVRVAQIARQTTAVVPAVRSHGPESGDPVIVIWERSTR